MKYFLGLSSQYTAGQTLSHLFATGSEFDLSELRAFLAAHYGSTYDHVAVYANGRTALSVALKAICKRGGKVVITSLTCYAVVQAVKAAGLVPIFADVDPKTLHFGGKELEDALKGEDNVQAVIVQNNLGIPADIEAIEKVAKARKLQIIEDLAHCAGVRYADGREAGTVGRAAILSFGKGKSVDVISGGAVVFADPLDPSVTQPEQTELKKETIRARFYPLLAAIIRGFYHIHPKLGRYLTGGMVRFHWIKRSADGKVDPKLRLTYWQCKLVLRQLKSLPHRGRKPIRDFYLVDNREDCVKELEHSGFYFREIWYDLPVCPERYFNKSGFREEECPVATDLAKKIVNIPTWYDKTKMRPAVRIIKKYLVNQSDISEDEVTETKEEFEKMSETFRIAKDAEKRKFQVEEQKKAEKAKKIAAKKEKLEKKVKALDGAPDEEISDETRDKKTSEKVKEKSEAVKSAAKKLIAKVPKKGEKKSGKSEKATKKPEDENLSDLEKSSGLLDRIEEKKPEEDEIVEEKKPEKKTAEADSEDLSRQRERRIASSPVTTGQASGASESASKPSSTSSKPAVMRQAKNKLSDREKLKLKLESGKKEGPSVI